MSVAKSIAMRSGCAVPTPSQDMTRTRRVALNARHARGFSLIEMVAAFLIFAIAVGVQMQVLATSLHTTRSSAEYTDAALWAESKLDTVGVGERIAAGSSSGRFDDRYRWQLDIRQVDPSVVEPPPLVGTAVAGLAPGQQAAAAATPGNGGVQLVSPLDIYQADLTVTWGDRSKPHSATFSTLRVVSPDPNQIGGAGAPAAGQRQTPGGVRSIQ